MDQQNVHHAVFKIQSFWRNIIHNRQRIMQEQLKLNKIKLFFTSISGLNIKIRQNNNKMDLLLYQKQIHPLKTDLTDNKQAQQDVKSYLVRGYELPYLFIHDNFIGTYDDLQILEDNGYIEDIISQKYLQRCLVCCQDRKKVDINCSECGLSFTFFDKNNK